MSDYLFVAVVNVSDYLFVAVVNVSDNLLGAVVAPAASSPLLSLRICKCSTPWPTSPVSEASNGPQTHAFVYALCESWRKKKHKTLLNSVMKLVRLLSGLGAALLRRTYCESHLCVAGETN